MDTERDNLPGSAAAGLSDAEFPDEAAPEDLPPETEDPLTDGDSEEFEPPPEKPPYVGSVKFFKNMILLAVVIAIAVPTGLAVSFFERAKTAAAHAETQTAALEALQIKYDALEQEKEAQEAVWSASAGGKAAQAQPTAYQALYPDFYVDAPMGETPEDEGVMYLTFDDGPSSNTPLLLNVLRNQDVKATFFVVGGDTEQQRQWMREIAAEGHTLGMHSYTHDYHTIYDSVEAFLDDYYKLYTNILEATGTAPTIFRFPGGSVNSYNYSVYREIIAEMLRRGFVFYDWNVSSGDASAGYTSGDEIIANVLEQAETYSRGIVLFHDAASKDSTVESLYYVIVGLRDRGFTFAPLTREVRPIVFNYEDYQKD